MEAATRAREQKSSQASMGTCTSKPLRCRDYLFKSAYSTIGFLNLGTNNIFPDNSPLKGCSVYF